ncbi:MAG: DUF2809 domain-containing protein [Planctomycetota bacterium]
MTVAAGLASRRYPSVLPTVLGKYPGDVLWALLVFLAWGVLLPRVSTLRLAAFAAITACAIEFAKLWHTPWLDAFRSTSLGSLLLGQVFSWHNLIAYACGIGFGVLCDAGVRALQSRRSDGR